MSADSTSGMVAVVRGLKDAGLAVTLYDNGKEFTLAPNSYANTQALQNHGRTSVLPLGQIGLTHGQYVPHQPHKHFANHQYQHYQNAPNPYMVERCMNGYPEVKTSATDAMYVEVPRNNTGTQVVDGRYASVYQATYCQMKPSNPTPLVTEFPPQRAVGSHGESNFVVGGTGCGDTKHKPYLQTSHNYKRGAPNWPVKETVCAAQPAIHTDAFAKSLRKYPQLSLERSSEIVERLITYTQAKNYGKIPSCHLSRQQYDIIGEDRTPKGKVSRGQESPRIFDDESPTRDKPKRDASEPIEFKKFFKNFEVRQLRDNSKSFKNNNSNATCNLHRNQPTTTTNRLRSPSPKVVPESHPKLQCQPSRPTSPYRQRSRSPGPKTSEQQQKYPMVHSEIQAAITMVCKQVETVPRIEPSKRSVKVMCPDAEQVVKGFCQTQVQTTHSTIEIPSQRLVLHTKKSRSIEQIGNRYINHNDIIENRNIKNTLVENNNAINVETDNSDNLPELNNRHSARYRNRRSHRRKVSKDFYNRSFDCKPYDIFRADISTCPSKHNVIRIVRSWLSRIPLKNHDFFRRLVSRDQILCFIVRRIKMIPKRIQVDKNRFRAEIIDIVEDIPIDIGQGDRHIYLKKIAEDLITKLDLTRITCAPLERSKRYYSHDKYVYNTTSNLKRNVKPSEGEIRNFVKNELIDAIHKSHLDINTCKARDVEDEIVDILNDTLDDVSIGNEGDIMEEIVSTLEDIGQILRFQASYFAKMLLNNFRKRFSNKTCIVGTDVGRNRNVDNTNATNYLISLRNDVAGHVVEVTSRYSLTNNSNVIQVVQDKVDLNITKDLDAYTLHLSTKINHWLNAVQSEMPQVRNCKYREIVVKDLVDNIVERQKYLQVLTSNVNENLEIEHLRYQIFEWLHKFIGENATCTLKKALELIKIIRSIPVPDLKKIYENRKQCFKEDCDLQTSKSFQTKNEIKIRTTSPVFTIKTQPFPTLGFNNKNDISKGDQSSAIYTSKRKQYTLNPAMLCNQNPIERANAANSAQSLAPMQLKSIEQLNIEFMDFLKQWVASIPIPPNTPHELEVRQGFLQGVMQAIAKIKSSPTIAINPLYYEDALEDELETLFSFLPQTDELLAKKHLMKVQLIKKNCYVNEKIKQSLAPNTFGQHVRDELSAYIPRIETNEKEEDAVKLYEELKILFLAEEYIMYLRFREEDEMTANVYKMKLLRKIQEFVQDLKQIHNKELQYIDDEAYIEDILAAMQNVPLPSDETIKQEADEIMLGMEIDKWFSDLPLETNDNVVEQFRRRRLRDQLAKKIHEMEQNINTADETGEQAVRHEVSMVLHKLPLQKDEDLKINFLVDELTNRIKNRKTCPADRKKTVGFQNSRNSSQNYPGGCCDVGATGQQKLPSGGQLQSQLTSGRWVTVPGTSMVVDEKQTIKDPDGRMWFTLDSRPNQQPVSYHSLSGTSLNLYMQPIPNTTSPSGQNGIIAGAANSMPCQVISQPGIPAQAQQAQPCEPSPGPGFGNCPGPSQLSKPAADGNNSLWLNKAVQDYEAKHPSLAGINQSIQFGPPRPNLIHDFTQTSNQPVACSSLCQPQTLHNVQRPKQTSHYDSLSEHQKKEQDIKGISAQKQQAQPYYNGPSVPCESAAGDNNSLWLNKAVQDYEAKHPSLAGINQSIQFGPPRPNVIHDLPQTSNQPVASSSLYQPQTSQNDRRHKLSSTYDSLTENQNQDGGWPYSLGHPFPTSRKFSPTSPNFAQNKSTPAGINQMPQQNTLDEVKLRMMGADVTQETIGPDKEIEWVSLLEGSMPVAFGPQPHVLSQPPSYLRSAQMSYPQPFREVPVLSEPVHSLQSSQAPVPLQMNVPPQAPKHLQPVPESCSNPANQSYKGFPGEAGPIASTDATGTMWLSKYLKDYEDAHPHLENTPNVPRQTHETKSNCIGSCVPPQNISILAPPDYRIFGQDVPLSSSLHQLQQKQENIPGEPTFKRPCDFSLPNVPVAPGQNSIQNRNPIPSSLKIPPCLPCHQRKTGIENISLTSAGHESPVFYKSTDREGIQRFTTHNKNVNQSLGQQGIVAINSGIQPYQSPQQRVNTGIIQTSNVQQIPEQQNTSRCFSCPNKPPEQDKVGTYRPTSTVQHTTGSCIPSRPPMTENYATLSGQPIGGTYETPLGPQSNGTCAPNLGQPDHMNVPRERVNERKRPNDDTTGDDSDGRCRCLDKMKKLRRNGFCRKCNRDFLFLMRCFPPCPWYYC